MVRSRLPFGWCRPPRCVNARASRIKDDTPSDLRLSIFTDSRCAVRTACRAAIAGKALDANAADFLGATHAWFCLGWPEAASPVWTMKVDERAMIGGETSSRDFFNMNITRLTFA